MNRRKNDGRRFGKTRAAEDEQIAPAIDVGEGAAAPAIVDAAIDPVVAEETLPGDHRKQRVELGKARHCGIDRLANQRPSWYYVGAHRRGRGQPIQERPVRQIGVGAT
jgi:hypothetical protein